MKRRRVKKSIVRLTKIVLAITMIFTTFTNLPTLVSADDTTGEQTVEVQEQTNTDVPVEPAPEPAPPVEEVPVVPETPVSTESEKVEVVEEESTEVETPVEQEQETVVEEDEEEQEIVETVVLPNTDNVLSNNTTVEEVKEVDQLDYDLNFETQEIMEPTKGFVGDEVEVGNMNVVREGYNFVYWYVLNDDGTETQYNPGDKYVLSEGEDKLVAKWEEVVTEVPNDDSESEEVVDEVTEETTEEVKEETKEVVINVTYTLYDENMEVSNEETLEVVKEVAADATEVSTEGLAKDHEGYELVALPLMVN